MSMKHRMLDKRLTEAIKLRAYKNKVDKHIEHLRYWINLRQEKKECLFGYILDRDKSHSDFERGHMVVRSESGAHQFWSQPVYLYWATDKPNLDVTIVFFVCPFLGRLLVVLPAPWTHSKKSKGTIVVESTQRAVSFRIARSWGFSKRKWNRQKGRAEYLNKCFF